MFLSICLIFFYFFVLLLFFCFVWFICVLFLKVLKGFSQKSRTGDRWVYFIVFWIWYCLCQKWSKERILGYIYRKSLDIYVFIYYIWNYLKSWKQCAPSWLSPQCGYVATHAIEHIIYRFILLVQMNQIVLKKLSRERNTSAHKWTSTRRFVRSHRSKIREIYI